MTILYVNSDYFIVNVFPKCSIHCSADLYLSNKYNTIKNGINKGSSLNLFLNR